MQTINLKKLFEDIQSRQIQMDINNGPQFNSLSTMLKLIDSDAKLQGHQYIEQIKILDKYLTSNQIKPQKIQVQVKKQKNQSDTNSLSLVSEQKSQVKLMESLYWFQLLGKNEKIFKPDLFNKNYVKIQKFDENYQFDEFSNLIIDKGYNTVIYSGMNLEDNSPIAIKETLVTKDYLEQASQFILHAEIYELYPNIFLKILLPVYVHSITPERLKFVSSMERGEINLFQYSQENKINDDEYQMIFQQLYNQVMLLHHHKIAHRDIKPQNIIFVKNKGWLLCDFEEALKYDKPSSIYNIRGTFGFIPSTIYQASKIGDVLLQQDLLCNDLYALGITLLVIKHQIKRSSDIEDYLDQQDEIIQKLLQNSLLHHNYVRTDVKIQYIEANLNKQKSINSQQLGKKQIKEYLNILRIVNLDKTLPFIQSVIGSLDNYLGKNDIEDIVYLSICQQIYYCPAQINQFKNIPNLKTFRSIRFWKQKIKTKDNIVKLISISFMAQLGFIDLVLQFGMQYLNNEYNFSIHMIVILILGQLQEKERASKEFELLLKFREQYYMNDSDLRLLIKTSLSILDLRLIDESELNYFQFQPVRIDVNKIQINLEDDDEVSCQSFMLQCQTYQETASDFWVDQTMTQNVKEQIRDVYRLSLNDKLNDQINKVHKYFSTAFHYQNSLKESVINKTLLYNSYQLRRIRKQMNYLLIHNSESKHQYQINNLLKQSAILYNKQIGKPMRQRALVKLSIILLKFSQLPYQYYKYILIEELQLILFQQLYDLDVSILKLIIFSINLVDQGLKICEQIKIKQLIYYQFFILRKLKNYRRVSNLNNNEIATNKDQMKFQNLLLKGKIKQIRILRKQNKLLQKEFLFDQYLHRGY
ncbi:hypothetical protein pb186bvf_001751 [Paramecium bursaria]